MKKNYDSIDLFKFIFSILIVALHADALYDLSPLANTLICGGIARLGVPFFFVASAFFFFKKPVTWNNTKKYCKRLLILYAAWFIVSLPKTIFDRFICSDYPLPETIIRFIRSFFVTSTFSGSWFIVSCIWCALLFYLLEKQKTSVRRTIVIALSILVYAWTVFTSAYGKTLDGLGMRDFYEKYVLLFGSPYCSLIVGIPYFAIGRYFAVKDSKKQESEGSKRPIAYAGLAACLAFDRGPVYQCPRPYSFYRLLHHAASYYGFSVHDHKRSWVRDKTRKASSRGVNDPFLFTVYTVIYMRACRMGLQNNDPQYGKVLVCRPLRSFSYMAYTEAPKQKSLRMA